jgi:hypothetical protein
MASTPLLFLGAGGRRTLSTALAGNAFRANPAAGRGGISCWARDDHYGDLGQFENLAGDRADEGVVTGSP